MSSLYRVSMDGNRRQSRHTEWRKGLSRDIRDSVAEYGKNGVMVLDVHSCWAGSHEYSDCDGEEPILSYISFDDRVTALCDRVREATGKTVTCFRSGRRNDITLECKELGVPCILIEHDEDPTRLNSDLLQTSVTVLSDYLKQYPYVAPTRPLPPRLPGPSEMSLFGLLIDEYAMESISLIAFVLILVITVATVGYAVIALVENDSPTRL